MSIISFSPPDNKGNSLVGNSTLKNAQRFATVITQDPDQLSNLAECKYNDISFPTTNITFGFKHRLVLHKYPTLNAAKIENTGRDPIIINCTAVFLNSISPGPTETWKKGQLYPITHQELMSKLLSRNQGVFQHPYYGNIVCRVSSVKESLNSDVRGGVFTDIEFIETIDQDFKIISKNIDVNSTASLVDSQLDQLIPDPASLGVQKPAFSLTSLVFNIRSTVGAITNFIPNSLGQINSLINQTDLLVTQVSTAHENIVKGKPFDGNPSFNAFKSNLNKFSRIEDNSKNIVTLSLLLINLKLFKGKLIDLKKDINTEDKDISVYVTRERMMMTDLVILLNSNIKDLILLNPILSRFPFIPVNKSVRYYG